jgi:hypothetical protein
MGVVSDLGLSGVVEDQTFIERLALADAACVEQSADCQRALDQGVDLGELVDGERAQALVRGALAGPE